MTNCTEKTNTTNTTAVYPNIRDIIANNDSNALDNACAIAVKSATKYLLLQLKNDGGTTQFNKIYGLYSGVRQAHIDDNDVLDLLSTAKLAYYETYASDSDNELDNKDYYKKAIQAVHREIYASGRAVPVEDLPPQVPKTIKPLSEKQLDNANNIITAITAVLSDKQIAIMQYLSKGMTAREIATTLSLSLGTISYHTAQIRKKALVLYPNGVQI